MIADLTFNEMIICDVFAGCCFFFAALILVIVVFTPKKQRLAWDEEVLKVDE